MFVVFKIFCLIVLHILQNICFGTFLLATTPYNNDILSKNHILYMSHLIRFFKKSKTTIKYQTTLLIFCFTKYIIIIKKWVYL